MKAFVIVGAPGSGKYTHALRLQTHGVVDEIIKLGNKNRLIHAYKRRGSFYTSEESILFEVPDDILKTYADTKKDICVVGDFVPLAARKHLISQLESAGYTVQVIICSVSLAELIERNSSRMLDFMVEEVNIHDNFNNIETQLAAGLFPDNVVIIN